MKIPRWLLILIVVLLFALLFLPYMQQPLTPPVVAP